MGKWTNVQIFFIEQGFRLFQVILSKAGFRSQFINACDGLREKLQISN